MSNLDKLTKTDDALTVHMYDNGFMVEVQGRDSNDDWATAKIICNSLDEVVDIIKEAAAMDRS
jgi:hypothetical protein